MESEKLSGVPTGERPQILVYGFYKSPPNLGDYLFTHAFQYLFPHLDFTFTDHISVDNLSQCDAVFIGGGSLLDGVPHISDKALQELKTKKIFYISIGAETDIHPIHKELLAQACVVAVRSGLEKIKDINSNAILIPDIIYSLRHQAKSLPKIPKSILVIPNAMVVPTWSEPHWKHVSFDFFKQEIAQVLDHYLKSDFRVDFYPFSQVAGQNDEWAAFEILNRMERKPYQSLAIAQTIEEITQLFSQYDVIITQRYHGAILAEVSQVPYLCLYHHDKLRNTNYNLGQFVSYFEVSKARLQKEIDFLLQNSIVLPIEQDIYKSLVMLVNKCLDTLE